MMNRNSRNARRGGHSWLRRQLAQRPLPVWVLIVTDVLLIGVSLVVFALFHHVLPRREDSTGIVSSRYQTQAEADADDGAMPVPVQGDGDGLDIESGLTAGDAGTDAAVSDAGPDTRLAGDAAAISGAEPEANAAPLVAAAGDGAAEAAPTAAPDDPVGYFGSKFPDKFTEGEVIKTASSYQSANVNITLSQYEYENAVFYYADIYLKDIECFRTAFANNEFGRGHSESPVEMNRRAGGVLAINGDYYGTRTDGVVIRNGELYRNKDITMDVCVLYWDGTMETYTKRQFSARKAMENGAYQAWHFGPKLLDEDGKPMTHFSNASIGPKNPRTVLGYYEPGHYCFVVVDGRSAASEGLTIKVLARLMSKLGCKRAYNLDGGATSMLLIGDKIVSNPYNGGRPSSDIILIADK